MTPPWKTATRMKKSQQQEARNGKLPGGSKQVNSGRHWFSKRDNQLTSFLVESRRTEAGSYRIAANEFAAIAKHALATPPGQLPAMQIDLAQEGRTMELWLMRLEDQVAQQQYIASLEARLGDG